MTVVNKFNVNKEQVTLDADIIENMSANDVSYNSSLQYDENTVGDKLSVLEKEVIYDVSAHNNDTVFESISDLLSDSNLSRLIPPSIRHGGMTIRFIQGSEQSSDNKYVQYRLMSQNWSIIPSNWQGVDDELTAGIDNLVKSSTVIPISMEIFGNVPVSTSILKSIKFDIIGYSVNRPEYCCSNKLGKGNYSLPKSDNFLFGVYQYVSDSSGKLRWSLTNSAITFTVEDNDYAIISIRSISNTAITQEEYILIDNWLKSITYTSGKITLDEIRNKCNSNENNIAEEALRSSQVDQILKSSIDNTNVVIYGSGQIHLNYSRSKRFDINGYSTNASYCSTELTEGNYATPDITNTNYYISVWKYISDSEGFIMWSDTKITREFTVNKGKNAILVIRKNDVSTLTDDDYAYINSLTISKNVSSGVLEDIDNIKNVIALKSTTDIEFSTAFSKDVLRELYLPNADSTWKIRRIYAKSSSFRIGIDTGDGINHIMGLDNVGLEYTNKVLKLIGSNGIFYGYCVLNYTGTDYAVDSTTSVLNIAAVTDKANSITINEYLSRKENIVLIGDSTWGKTEQNLLGNILSSLSTKQVFNCGFGGCDMSWRTSDGSSEYDKMTWVGVVDAIVDNDYQPVKDAALLHPNKRYEISAAELEEVNWNNPTTIIIHYGGNDLTRDGKQIGSLWNWDDELSNYDKTTILGAFNYGVQKLLTTYPHIRIIQCNIRWSSRTNPVNPDYERTEKLLLNEKFSENAARIGISLFDMHNCSGNNKWNKDYYQIDDAHANIRGYIKYAKMLNALDKSEFQ